HQDSFVRDGGTSVNAHPPTDDEWGRGGVVAASAWASALRWRWRARCNRTFRGVVEEPRTAAVCAGPSPSQVVSRSTSWSSSDREPKAVRKGPCHPMVSAW